MMMILVECATPMTSHCHPYALAWAQFHFWFRHSTIASLCTRLLLLATVQRPCTTASGLRPLSYVIPTAFGCDFVMRFRHFGDCLVLCVAMSHFSHLHYRIWGLHWPNVVSPHARAPGWQCDVMVVAHSMSIIITWCKFAFWGGGCVSGVSLVVALLNYLALLLSGLCFQCGAKSTSYP